MEKNRFIEELFYELSCQLGKEFEMKQKRVWKNNGVSYEGLVIEKLEEELSPVVSLDRCYEDFQAGISVQEIRAGFKRVPQDSGEHFVIKSAGYMEL